MKVYAPIIIHLKYFTANQPLSWEKDTLRMANGNGDIICAVEQSRS